MDANDKASIEQRLRALKDTLALSAHLRHGYAVEGLTAETVGSLYAEDGVSTPRAVAKSSMDASMDTSAEQQSDR
jgi:hypothetical protein